MEQLGTLFKNAVAHNWRGLRRFLPIFLEHLGTVLEHFFKPKKQTQAIDLK